MVLGPAGDILYNVAHDGKIAFTDWDLEGNMILSGQERLDARYNTATMQAFKEYVLINYHDKVYLS